nr:bone morphogenetic protein antagonist noggin [Hymenolepis microstoma]
MSKPSAHPGLSIVTTSIGGAGAHLVPNNADYSRKVSVSVGSILNQQEAAAAASKSEKDRSRGNVGTRSVPSFDPTALRLQSSMLSVYPSRMEASSLYGDKYNGASTSYLQPDLSRGTIAKLRVILGADYDDAWMSVEPRPPGNESTGYPPSSAKQKLLQQVGNLNFTIYNDVPGVGRQETHLTEKEADVLRKWLVQKADCPVQYVWRDNGNRYWPRWIRHAVCKEGVACSWPSGMQCKPSGTKTLTLLRWVCSKQSLEEVQKRARRNYLRRARSLYNPAGSSYTSYNVRARKSETESRKRFTREERRSKRVKRLVRQLSRSYRDYYCQWQRDTTTLQPECSCMC